MLEAQVMVTLHPAPAEFITVRVGDRVKHWAGDTGTVIAIESRFAYVDEYPGGEHAVYRTHIIVRRDKRKRERKEPIAASWDGIIEVLA